MSAPSQKAREFQWAANSFEEDLDSFTLELREALREACDILEAVGYSGVAEIRSLLFLYEPTPEEEKG